ncbi:MAG: hypothetical protein IJX90_06295 [Blautia sp.]|nr:hypothetical protein [Blautia sp.]
MGKLLKYEFRKTMFLKLIMLVLTAVAEVLFLFAAYRKDPDSPLIGISIFLLVMIASAGITFIGLYSMLVLQRDLNTKQSYMLFMTPHSGYTIVGAKVLENGISLLLTGVFYSLLAALDIYIIFKQYVTLDDIVRMIQDMLRSMDLPTELSATTAVLIFFTLLASWLSTIVCAYLAIILSAAVLAGKRFSGVVSFILFLAITIAFGRIANLILKALPSMKIESSMLVQIGMSLVLSVILYLISGWMVDKKLSV